MGFGCCSSAGGSEGGDTSGEGCGSDNSFLVGGSFGLSASTGVVALLVTDGAWDDEFECWSDRLLAD